MPTIEQVLVLLLTSKVCPRCETRKDLSGFYPLKAGRLGVSSLCKACDCKEKRNLPRDVKDAANERHKLRVKAWSPEKKAGWLAYGRAYRQTNKKTLNEKSWIRVRNRLRSDPHFRLIRYLRSRPYRALRGSKKGSKTLEYLGMPVEKFRDHLESKFYGGMTWKNYGPVWHVDHKIPLSKFDLTGEEGRRKAFHWSNLQPLLAADNLIKGDRV